MCLSHLNGQCIPPLSVERGQRKYIPRVEARFDSLAIEAQSTADRIG